MFKTKCGNPNLIGFPHNKLTNLTKPDLKNQLTI